MALTFALSIPVTVPDALELEPAAAIEATIAGPALDAALHERLKQLAKGYTPEADLEDEPWRHLDLARQYVAMAHDFVRTTPERRDLPRALTKAAQSAALAMAAYDRIAAEIRLERERTLAAEVLGEAPDDDAEDVQLDFNKEQSTND